MIRTRLPLQQGYKMILTRALAMWVNIHVAGHRHRVHCVDDDVSARESLELLIQNEG